MHVQIGVFWAVMLCSVMASCQTARYHITGDNNFLYKGRAARTLYFTGIFILPPSTLLHYVQFSSHQTFYVPGLPTYLTVM